MTEWTVLKRLLDAVHQHSTMIGRIWLTVMVIFRLLIVAVATEDVYTDEQDMFVCNTLQPGCANLCYDSFAPISHARFWVFQIILVSTPSLCFIVYTWHNLSKINGESAKEEICAVQHGGCGSSQGSCKSHGYLDEAGRSGPGGVQRGRRTTSRRLVRCYVVHVCCRAALEVGFVAAQCALFGFQVPPRFLCSAPPCAQAVDCYVSRPTEKTIFLMFTFSVGVLCSCLNFLELNHLGWKKIKRSLLTHDFSQGGYQEIRSPDTNSVDSLTLRGHANESSLASYNLEAEHNREWTFTGVCSPGGQKMVDSGRGEDRSQGGASSLKVKPGKSKGGRQKSGEVWI
ncbi:gap junction protein delta 6 [Erpetoichthys calabaricus]|uniref:gap junction protein delta 6 n=1 Tax=Erpetoichthys calabaricus TaxID=27687 RepID=UPI00109EFCFC|nr:gap junction protein delta 6 [Erpetoichthys calabaricus]